MNHQNPGVEYFKIQTYNFSCLTSQALEEKQRRQQIIARLPNIERLNGSPVLEGEREDAERAFIRLYMDQDVKPNRWVGIH